MAKTKGVVPAKSAKNVSFLLADDKNGNRMNKEERKKQEQREKEKQRLRLRIRSRMSEILAVHVDYTPDSPAADEKHEVDSILSSTTAFIQSCALIGSSGREQKISTTR